MSIYLAGPISAKTPQKEAENKLRFFAKANELEGLGMKGWEDSKGSVLEMEACIRKQKDDPNFLITKEQ